MADRASVLLVDIGNSSIKYASLEAKDKEPSLAADMPTFMARIATMDALSHVYLANVRQASFTQQLKQYCDIHEIQLRVIESEQQAFGITNSYQDVSKMGVDRWLAMIAAAQYTEKAFAVIDSGTAITCDFVIDGQHLGGWISPGFEIMRSALLANTARVTADNRIPEQLEAGQDTEACVAFGCLASLRGVYLSAVGYLTSKQTDFSIIIGGGGKKLLTSLDQADSIRVANLVVQGLARYAENDLFA
ncbi:type III pantothenate kinase [Alteromonas aestuariivivens]|uniref:Type III pantothenate kinase n=1 Tax=Alteromonas aestuariivivens TaxID=1938339 RepID=A0A3D8M2F6_9ALTE|nr:type III pantothenate kinase [Alteromonas aestuariivivens]RDV23887.1 type III pantothenate kinase [Alteromonas aestuariivivens]